MAPTACRCGWGVHCRCVAGRRSDRALIDLITDVVAPAVNPVRRRRAAAELRNDVERYHQRRRDQRVLFKLYRSLPRDKDVAIVMCITGESYEARGFRSDKAIASAMRAPIARVRDLRARLAAAYDGRPLPVPPSWAKGAKARADRYRRAS